MFSDDIKCSGWEETVGMQRREGLGAEENVTEEIVKFREPGLREKTRG